MENEPKELVLKPTRIYFMGNYLIAILVFIFLALVYVSFNLKLTLFPQTQDELFSTMIFLGILGIGAAMLEQPEWERFRSKIIITMNDVVKEEGIIRKHRVSLPYGTVADARVEKGVMGRVFNYGTLIVSSFKEGSDMKMHGVRNPMKIHTIIQNRVNKLREGQLEFWEKSRDGDDDGAKPKETREDLENKKKEVQEMIEQTKQSFYNREIDEKQFERTVEKFEQQIIELDVKIKKLDKK